MSVFNFDNSNIHLVFSRSRLLPDETVKLWMETIHNELSHSEIRSIVDLGCGTGRFTKALSDYFDAEVFGIDPSEKMLSVAMSSIKSPRIKFIRDYAESIPLEDSSTDMVFMSHIYHHIQDKKKAIKEVYRVLEKNKFLCIRQATLEDLDTYLYPDFFPNAKKIDTERLPSKKNLLKIVEDNGFSLLKYQIIRQLFANNRIEYYEKISLRGTSDLTAISDKEFYEGLDVLKDFCYTNEPEKPVYENVGLFIFRSI